MKKFLPLFVFLSVLLGFSANALASTTVTYVGGSTNFASGVNPTTVYVYKATGTSTSDYRGQFTSTGSNNYVLVPNDLFYESGENSYRYVSSGAFHTCATPLNYADCVTAQSTDKITEGTLTYNFANMYSAGVAGFTATAGFPTSDVVSKVGTYLVKFLGGGLGLVDALIGWIIAIIIITVIVRLIFHGLRWLHILR